jgi:hypothetical protein
VDATQTVDTFLCIPRIQRRLFKNELELCGIETAESDDVISCCDLFSLSLVALPHVHSCAAPCARHPKSRHHVARSTFPFPFPAVRGLHYTPNNFSCEVIKHGEKLVRPTPGLGGNNRGISASRASCAAPRASGAAWACPDGRDARSDFQEKGGGHACAGGSKRFKSLRISVQPTPRAGLTSGGCRQRGRIGFGVPIPPHARAWRDRESGGVPVSDIMKSPQRW